MIKNIDAAQLKKTFETEILACAYILDVNCFVFVFTQESEKRFENSNSQP